MRIRKQSKQALSLVFGTLATVFAVALLLITIADLNIDNRLVSDMPLSEASQSQSQSSGQELTHQEPPVKEPAAPPSSIEEDLTKGDPNTEKFNTKSIFAVIGFIALVTIIVAGVVFLIYSLTRRSVYIYEGEDNEPEKGEDDELEVEDMIESAEWERNISNRLSHVITKSDEQDSIGKVDTVKEKNELMYQEGRGYCYPLNLTESNLQTDASSINTHDGSDESDIDFVDIPRLFSMRSET